MARRFAKVSEEEIEKAFFDPYNLVNGGHRTKNSFNLIVYPTQIHNMTFTIDESTSMVLLKGSRFLQSRPQWVQNTYPLEGFECMLPRKKKVGNGNATKCILKAFWQGNFASHQST